MHNTVLFFCKEGLPLVVDTAPECAGSESPFWFVTLGSISLMIDVMSESQPH